MKNISTVKPGTDIVFTNKEGKKEEGKFLKLRADGERFQVRVAGGKMLWFDKAAFVATKEDAATAKKVISDSAKHAMALGMQAAAAPKANPATKPASVLKVGDVFLDTSEGRVYEVTKVAQDKVHFKGVNKGSKSVGKISVTFANNKLRGKEWELAPEVNEPVQSDAKAAAPKAKAAKGDEPKYMTNARICVEEMRLGKSNKEIGETHSIDQVFVCDVRAISKDYLRVKENDLTGLKDTKRTRIVLLVLKGVTDKKELAAQTGAAPSLVTFTVNLLSFLKTVL